MGECTCTSPQIFTIGNPLLDIVIPVSDRFLDDHNLERSQAYLYDSKINGTTFYDEVGVIPNALYLPGGSTLNSARMAQALVLAAAKGGRNSELYTDGKLSHRVGYAGCIANDNFGKKLKALCDEAGLKTFFQETNAPNKKTGVCAVCVHESGERSLCTALEACLDFRAKLFEESGCWSNVEAARLIYSAGYFLAVEPSLAKQIAERVSKRHGALYATNTSATYIVDAFLGKLLEVLKFTDILFGNETEFAALADSLKLFGSKDESESFTDPIAKSTEIASRLLLRIPGPENRGRMIVISHGSSPTIVVTEVAPHNCVSVQRFPVNPLSREQIVDTNGAGDAFVGGFLFGADLTMKQSTAYPSDAWSSPDMWFDLKCSIELAHAAARHVVQRSGFDFKIEDLLLDCNDIIDTAC